MMKHSITSLPTLVCLLVAFTTCAGAIERHYLTNNQDDLLQETDLFSTNKHVRPGKYFQKLFALEKTAKEGVRWKNDLENLALKGDVPGKKGATVERKRQLKFNPTGWRKKRSTGDLEELERLFSEDQELKDLSGDEDQRLKGLSENELKLIPVSDKLRLMLKPVIIRRNNNNGRRASNLGDILANLRSYLAKRKGKPLDFNPTGW